MESSNNASFSQQLPFQSIEVRLPAICEPCCANNTRCSSVCSRQQPLPSSSVSSPATTSAYIFVPPTKRARYDARYGVLETQNLQQQRGEQKTSFRERLPAKFKALTISPPVMPTSHLLDADHEELQCAARTGEEPTPLYLGTSKLPVDGWFQSCRGCGTWTACVLGVRDREVPMCKRCQHQFAQLTASTPGCSRSCGGAAGVASPVPANAIPATGGAGCSPGSTTTTSSGADSRQSAAEYWSTALIDVDASWRHAIEQQVKRSASHSALSSLAGL